MIPLANLNAASEEEFVAVLGGIYEHSDWVPQRIFEQRPFPNAEILRSAMREAVEQASEEDKLALICAHPDLAGKLARAGVLTEASTREQAGLGLDRLNEVEYEAFSDRNRNYRERFGFPFIICARKTTKQGVLNAFETRLLNPREAEIEEALAQIHEIAKLRLEDLIG
jgi:2-oxo-4-hydroxy-4-carboxy-5-ureidoimidazoline decarboxylase